MRASATPLVGDVVKDVDHEVHLARIVQERRRAEDRPALVASREDAIAENGFLRRALRECQPVRQLLHRHRRPVLADDLEPPEQFRHREAEQLLARLQSTQARGGIVGVDEPSVRALGGDPVADGAEDRGQLVRRQRNLIGPPRVDRRLADRTHCSE